VDVDRIRPDARGRAFREEWGLGADRKIVLYAGSMGNKQGLEMVLETARALQNDDPEILFLLVGEGSAKEGLVQQTSALGLRNVVFKPPQPPEDLPALLTLADIHLVVQKKGVAEAFMPSKLTGILAAGGMAIITADEDTNWAGWWGTPGIAVLVPPKTSGCSRRRCGRNCLAWERWQDKPCRPDYAERYLQRMEFYRNLKRCSPTGSCHESSGHGKPGKCLDSRQGSSEILRFYWTSLLYRSRSCWRIISAVRLAGRRIS